MNHIWEHYSLPIDYFHLYHTPKHYKVQETIAVTTILSDLISQSDGQPSNRCTFTSTSHTASNPIAVLPILRQFYLHLLLIPALYLLPQPGSGKIFDCLQAGFFSGSLPTMELNNFQTFLIHSRFRNANLVEISLKSN